MKKILAILLALILTLGIATSAMAVSWAAPLVGSSGSPFSIEVIKLGINTDITGAKYYTVATDAAAFDFSTIYYAIKLVVPSYANANAHYGNSGFLSGDKVKVTVSYNNVSGKGYDTYWVKLTDKAQTLFLNARTNEFDPTWTASLSNNCGCGDSHIHSAIASGTKEVSIKATVGATGELSSLSIGDYKVEEKTFYGVLPCVNCTPQTLKGFYFKSNCAANGAFFAVNSANKVTSVYAVNSFSGNASYYGALTEFKKVLYGWVPNGTMQSCTGSCGIMTFAKTELPKGGKINKNWTKWYNTNSVMGYSRAEMIAKFDEWKNTPEIKSKGYGSYDDLFYIDDYNKEQLCSWDKIAPSGMAQPATKLPTLTPPDSINNKFHLIWWSMENVSGITKGSKTSAKYKINGTGEDRELFSAYEYSIEQGSTPDADYFPISYRNTWYGKASTEDARLFRQTSPTTVDCDYLDATMLNTLNFLYGKLGFTFADVAAGNIYMTKDILMSNFGFKVEVYDTKVWSPYTAAIVVSPVAEVPATGSATYVGFAMIALAIAAAVVTKKVRA